jgi:hypothetical protein
MSGIGRSQGLLGTDDVGDFNFPDDVLARQFSPPCDPVRSSCL